MILYGIQNCDKCRKARQWLTRTGLAHQWHDIRKDGLDDERIAAWIATVGSQPLINKKSRTWRELGSNERQLADQTPTELLSRYPTLLKRPVLETGDQVLVGFSEDDYSSHLS